MIATSPILPLTASNSSLPGPDTHDPSIAVSAPPGIDQYPANARKWSTRVRSYSSRARSSLRAHQANPSRWWAGQS